jgi:hypothetical protein
MKDRKIALGIIKAMLTTEQRTVNKHFSVLHLSGF